MSLGVMLGTIGLILGCLGHLNLNRCRPEGHLDCQGRLLKNSGQILKDVSLFFAMVVRF